MSSALKGLDDTEMALNCPSPEPGLADDANNSSILSKGYLQGKPTNDVLDSEARQQKQDTLIISTPVKAQDDATIENDDDPVPPSPPSQAAAFARLFSPSPGSSARAAIDNSHLVITSEDVPQNRAKSPTKEATEPRQRSSSFAGMDFTPVMKVSRAGSRVAIEKDAEPEDENISRLIPSN